MGSPREHLSEWQRAGLIDSAIADRIMAYEERGSTLKSENRPGFTEVLVYLGIAIVGVGVIVLAATNWGHLGSWARVLVPGVPAVLALIAGYVMLGQSPAGIQRGGSAAWLASVALIGGTAAVIVNEGGGAGEDAALVASVAAGVAALVLWLRHPNEIQVAAGAGALFILAIAITAETARGNERFAQLAGGGTLMLMGLAGVVAAETGMIHPRGICRILAGAAIAFGSIFATAGEDPAVVVELLPLAAGALLLLLGVRFGFFPQIIFGVAVIFAGTIELVVRHVDDPTLAALALMLLGAALIGVVLFLAKVKPWKRGSGGAGFGEPPALA